MFHSINVFTVFLLNKWSLGEHKRSYFKSIKKMSTRKKRQITIHRCKKVVGKYYNDITTVTSATANATLSNLIKCILT